MRLQTVRNTDSDSFLIVLLTSFPDKPRPSETNKPLEYSIYNKDLLLQSWPQKRRKHENIVYS